MKLRSKYPVGLPYISTRLVTNQIKAICITIEAIIQVEKTRPYTTDGMTFIDWLDITILMAELEIPNNA
ncbi:hypothetical protein GCM10007392_26140 [Saccharospirillum salsuginis]|uniref:Uncharacterized protein n=1 Tax=Saccharospirillum salsuginis TaxID=418750 RepID=A0A918KDB7_9GAMM|nr:hypothetical protein GCM10007392_26140 [Saccharospirillum salsuginis]